MNFKEIMRGIWIGLIGSKKYCCYKEQLDTIGPKAKIDYNVYESGPTMGEYVKEQNTIHTRFKRLMIYPFVWFARKFLGKYLVINLSKAPQFKNLNIFSTAFEDACKDFCYYHQEYKFKGDNITQEDLDKRMKSEPIPMLIQMKNLLLTLAKNDTAYMEFMNFLMFQIAGHMNKNHVEFPVQVIYNSSRISDPAYFVAITTTQGIGVKEIRARKDSLMTIQNVQIKTKDAATETTEAKN